MRRPASRPGLLTGIDTPSLLEGSIGSAIRYTVFGSAAVPGSAEIVSTNSLGTDPVFAATFEHGTDPNILNRVVDLQIHGTVDLGPGNDLYDGRQGFVAELPRTDPFPQVPWVYGGLGDDTFINSAFADNVNGGLGIDTLSGGPGSDVFVIANAAEYGDRITDFSNVAGNDDVIRIPVYGSGLNVALPKGQLAARYFCSY